MTERRPPTSLSTSASDEPEIEPLQFVVRENAQGEQTVDVVEGSFEQSYRIGGTYTTKLFVDLCRSRAAASVSASAPARRHNLRARIIARARRAVVAVPHAESSARSATARGDVGVHQEAVPPPKR